MNDFNKENYMKDATKDALQLGKDKPDSKS